MTNKEFIKNYVLPYCDKTDKPKNRQIYTDQKDSLHRDGLITDKQVYKWCYPNTKLFN